MRPRGAPPPSPSKSQVYGSQQTFVVAEEARALTATEVSPGKETMDQRLRRQSAERVRAVSASSSSSPSSVRI